MSEYTIEGAMELASRFAMADRFNMTTDFAREALRDYITKLVEQKEREVVAEWKGLAQSLLELKQTDQRIKQIAAKYGLDAARSASVEGGKK